MEKRLNALLRLAISHHATDIHFTLYQNEMVIEMRINNAIRKVKIQNGDDKLIKYLQYLSNLDIGNIKIPQTGQFEWYIDGKTLSLRFALINTQSMINGVLRILNEDLDINLNNLSYKESDREFFKKMLKKRITFDYSYINKINYILKENEITYKEFDKDVIYEFTYEEGNYPKGLDNYIK